MSGLDPTVRDGAPTTLRADAVLTNAYVNSDPIDLKSYDSVTIMIKIGTTQAKTCNTKFQWSMDGTTYADEPCLVNGTVASGEQPQVPSARRVDIDISTTANHYIERFHRLAQFLRVAVKSDATTTGTISILAEPSISGN